MPTLDQIMSDLKADIVTTLAPYQPNLPPTYPNLDTRAGTITPTLVTAGEPMQYNVMERLENHYTQVAIYFADGVVKSLPYTNSHAPTRISPLTLGVGTYWLPIGHGCKDIHIEIWAYDPISRDAIDGVLSAHFGDFMRLTNATDGTIELFRFKPPEDVDKEQLDSVYVRRYVANCDFLITQAYTIATVTETELRTTLPDGSVNTAMNP